MCEEAPAMLQLKDNLADAFPSTTFLGIFASPAHFADAHPSSHNCASTPGGQESALHHPVTGQLVDYPDEFVHALDRGFTDPLVGGHMRNALLMGPRKLDVRYVIDHQTGITYFPDWRGGGSNGGATSGVNELHTSGSPWCTFDASNWIHREMTPADRERIAALAKTEAATRRELRVKVPRQRGRDVMELQTVLNRPVAHPFGPGTSRALNGFQEFFHLPITGTVNRATWEIVLFIYLAHGFGF
jgi:Putative peptidoglycan binding domain